MKSVADKISLMAIPIYKARIKQLKGINQSYLNHIELLIKERKDIIKQLENAGIKVTYK
jgi:prefoldin subunit 5